jgi:hypothetical protein
MSNLPSLHDWIHIEFPQLLAAYEKTQGHKPEPDFEWACFQTYRRFMEPDIWPFDRMLRHELGDDNPAKPNPNSGPIVHLVTSGPIFRERDTNNPHRVSSVTGFNLIDQLSKGINIDPFLDKYNRSNRVRTFAYVPWTGVGWAFPSNENVKNFIGHLLDKNKATSICLLTDRDPNQISKAKSLISYLNQFDLPGLLLEGVNEPLTHDKTDPSELKNALSSSKYLWGSGVYEDLKKFFGKVGYIHTPRDNEWPRKAKDAIEAYRGGGPNSPDEPACGVPWILDEPIRPDQCGFNTLDYYCYGAFGSLASAGITFHCESAKLGKMPSDEEYSCYNALMDGMSVFPKDAPLGQYEHLRDLEEEGETALRIFGIGKYITVIRPNGVKIPSNWKSLDNKNVCYEIK